MHAPAGPAAAGAAAVAERPPGGEGEAAEKNKQGGGGARRSSSPPPPAAAAGPAPVPLLAVDPRFAGTWIKLKDKSSSMVEALDALALHGLPRRAAGLVRGVTVQLRPKGGGGAAAAAAEGSGGGSGGGGSGGGSGGGDKPAAAGGEAAAPALSSPSTTPVETEFEFDVFSPLPILRVRERYVIGGPLAKARRRDLRRGQHSGRALAAEGGACLRLELEWPDPHGGRGCDEFRLNEAGELVISSELRVNAGGQLVKFFAVHRRK